MFFLTVSCCLLLTIIGPVTSFFYNVDCSLYNYQGRCSNCNINFGCTTCSQGCLQIGSTTASGLCVRTCRSGYYCMGNFCTSCQVDNCHSCTFRRQCNRCKSNYYLYENEECVSSYQCRRKTIVNGVNTCLQKR